MFTTEDVVALTRLLFIILYIALQGSTELKDRKMSSLKLKTFMYHPEKQNKKILLHLSPQRCQKLQNTVCLSLLFLVHAVCLERGFHYF